MKDQYSCHVRSKVVVAVATIMCPRMVPSLSGVHVNIIQMIILQCRLTNVKQVRYQNVFTISTISAVDLQWLEH